MTERWNDDKKEPGAGRWGGQFDRTTHFGLGCQENKAMTSFYAELLRRKLWGSRSYGGQEVQNPYVK